MVFANMAYNPATLAQLKRHATHIPPAVRIYIHKQLHTSKKQTNLHKQKKYII